MGKSLGVILTRVAIGILIEETKVMLPWLSVKLLAIPVRLLPGQFQDRYREEWASHLTDVPGPLSKLFFVLSLTPTGMIVRFDSWRQSRHMAHDTAPYTRFYRLALLTLVVLLVRYRWQKAMEWLGLSRPRAKILGIDGDVFVAILLATIVYICGVQTQIGEQ